MVVDFGRAIDALLVVVQSCIDFVICTLLPVLRAGRARRRADFGGRGKPRFDLEEPVGRVGVLAVWQKLPLNQLRDQASHCENDQNRGCAVQCKGLHQGGFQMDVRVTAAETFYVAR